MRRRRLLRRTGLELLHLRARIDVDDRLTDLSYATAEVPRDLRQLLGAEEQQDHDSERDQLPVSGHGGKDSRVRSRHGATVALARTREPRPRRLRLRGE